MCPPKPPAPPPPPPAPPPPPQIIERTVLKNVNTGAVQAKPATAGSSEAKGRNVNAASTAERKRLGRGSLRIPLASVSGGSGTNFPTS